MCLWYAHGPAYPAHDPQASLANGHTTALRLPSPISMHLPLRTTTLVIVASCLFKHSTMSCSSTKLVLHLTFAAHVLSNQLYHIPKWFPSAKPATPCETRHLTMSATSLGGLIYYYPLKCIEVWNVHYSRLKNIQPQNGTEVCRLWSTNEKEGY